MNFKPILFSMPMVQAILNGTKTQTRRVVKPQPPSDYSYEGTDTDKSSGESIFYACWEGSDYHNIKSPYGNIGDVLWVRETFVQYPVIGKNGPEIEYEYKADESPVKFRWKPGIHMPKEACRLFLKIKDIRVEKLQDISRGDCMAEGCPFPNIAKETDPIGWYFQLWKKINGFESLQANPWVWVIEFERIEKPENFI